MMSTISQASAVENRTIDELVSFIEGKGEKETKRKKRRSKPKSDQNKNDEGKKDPSPEGNVSPDGKTQKCEDELQMANGAKAKSKDRNLNHACAKPDCSSVPREPTESQYSSSDGVPVKNSSEENPDAPLSADSNKENKSSSPEEEKELTFSFHLVRKDISSRFHL